MTKWGARAAALLEDLAKHSEPGPGVTRFPFTPEHRTVLDHLQLVMQAAGLTTRLDDAGTLIGRREGPTGTGTFLLGSHQDTVRNGGAFDGIMGVVLPILALEKLREDGVILPFAVEVLAFADEEGVRFPTALVGPRALAGTFDPAVLGLKDSGGTDLATALREFGLEPEKIGDLARSPDAVLGYLEAHIEQGPVLEAAGEALGVVTAICGIERHDILLTGETGHAGTVPMELRRDALVGAAELVLAVNELANTTTDLRGTIGAFNVSPNVVNAVPGEVRLKVELRSPFDVVRQAAGRSVAETAPQLAARYHLDLSHTQSYAQPARPCSENLSTVLRTAVINSGGSGIELPSGATHDASAMADLCPTAMLFLRCRDGVSHVPTEHATIEDMDVAVTAIAGFLTSL